MNAEPTMRNAARLTYKALHTTLSPINDSEYRELLALCRADPTFRRYVEDVAAGMELQILDLSEQRGLIVVPASKDSRFAVRLTDIRSGMTPDQKAALILAHIAIAAVFFPTTDGLDDDNYSPPPASVATCRDTLYALARRLKETSDLPPDIPSELAPGWETISALPVAIPSGQRASHASVVGVVKIALNQMAQNGLVRLDRDAEDEAAATYTPTFRLRVQLRELALRRLYEMAQLATTERKAA
ncbi:hypothetical protein F6X40_41200 [Paraburkholderia sp. UCT31]|uniref:hypothetical protein n=1 Tax=Paraburkholderia sp. UCT31 TaxID=2615209 RepID=UPI00165512D4|nr:hypothetical protein [Paraburkholderia sp. UCT31]MBC8742883.1 hypothetical protein [Paraburkholderia sp. UCT31]